MELLPLVLFIETLQQITLKRLKKHKERTLENIGNVLCIPQFCLLVVRFKHCAHSEPPLECLSLFCIQPV
jgi:hypothetical protein